MLEVWLCVYSPRIRNSTQSTIRRVLYNYAFSDKLEE